LRLSPDTVRDNERETKRERNMTGNRGEIRRDERRGDENNRKEGR